MVERVQSSGLAGLLPGAAEEESPAVLGRRRLGLAQMLLGGLTEERFEVVSRGLTGGRALTIEDHRLSRSDTDYRLMNGYGKPVCRINIKFHGTLFRQAAERVGLEPEDCFALATYKIYSALQRQEEERLPYVFLVLSVPGLNAATVAETLPGDLVWFLSLVRGKRDVEEAIVARLKKADYQELLRGVRARISEGEFRVISARRAHNLLRDNLFERVFALRQRGFTRAYANAEIDMHFSLSREMTPLAEFLSMFAHESLQVLAIRLDRGEI